MGFAVRREPEANVWQSETSCQKTSLREGGFVENFQVFAANGLLHYWLFKK